MEPITQGMTGAAVEDIQERLCSIGYKIDQKERDAQDFGISTATAVTHFRLNMGLPLGQEVDSATWIALVDESYKMGDRTLYLRLPNFHGADVRQLQRCLNVLGFSAGEEDGRYGPHTEAAVKQFQESMGQLPDGMAFPDTFDAIDRLHHVWAGKSASGPHPLGAMGFARAANVLEKVRISITAEDPISRNIAGRVWNLASATNEKSGMDIIASVENKRPGDHAVLVLATSPNETEAIPNVIVDDPSTLAMRIRTAWAGSKEEVPVIRIEFSQGGPGYDGTFTVGDAQTYAVMLLDAICTAFDEENLLH
ncbi:MAG: peptidoglycan-binding domain-containing protein [Coriobacteriales bacterium]|nr:peptidoglycan-binding domain-containing protein [Coriobacteriales bacterium]